MHDLTTSGLITFTFDNLTHLIKCSIQQNETSSKKGDNFKHLQNLAIAIDSSPSFANYLKISVYNMEVR